MKRRLAAYLLVTLSVIFMSTGVQAETAPETSNEGLPAIVTFGGRASDSIVEGLTDILIPFHHGPHHVLFLNPRVSATDRSEEELNIGIGVRRLFDDQKLILGANAYYDSRWSRYNNRFEQFGFGVELMSEWVDARANYYRPESKSEVIQVEEVETTTSRILSERWGAPVPRGHDIRQARTRDISTTTTRQRFERYEEAMEGFDAEIGVRLPIFEDLAETRVFGGYYKFNSRFDDDLKGFKARLEIRAMPGLTFDAEYFEDKELHGSDYFVGARVHVPFNIGALFSGRNPFEGAGEYFRHGTERPFRDRMLEMVMRDIKIQHEESDFIENEAARSVSTTRARVRESVKTVKDINFVDQDSASPIENGTWEHPYREIQEGVDKAFGRQHVFVLAAAGPYQENVVLTEGVKLIGSSLPLRLPGNHFFYVGGLPFVDGMNLGPTITAANRTFIGGFGVLNTDFGNPAMDVTVAGATFDISRAGIVGLNASDVVIARNVVVGTSIGIALAAEGLPRFRSRIKDNTVVGTDEIGIGILGVGASGRFEADVTGNAVVGGNGPGIGIDAFNYSQARVNLSDNILVGNDGPGAFVELFATGRVAFNNYDNIIVGNNGPGVIFLGISGGPVLADTRDVLLVGNDGDGLLYEMLSIAGGVDASFTRVQSVGNNGIGVGVMGMSLLGDTHASFNNVFAIGNDGPGVGAEMASLLGDSSVGFNNVLAVGNNGPGVVGFASSILGDASVSARNVLALGNAGEGVLAVSQALLGDASVSLDSIASVANAQEGVVGAALSEFGHVNVDARNIIAVDNGADGVFLFGASILGDVDIRAERILAVLNGDDGVQIDAVSDLGDIKIRVISVFALDNDDDGVNINADSIAGDIDIKLRQVEAHFNGDEGIDLDAYTVFGDVNVDVARSGANFNDDDGIRISTGSDMGDVWVRLADVEASGNMGDGIFTEAYAGGRIYFTGRRLIANDNGDTGINLDLESDFGVDARLVEVQANDNGNAGIFVDARTLVEGDSTILVRHSEVLNNGGFGLFLSSFTESGDAVNVLYFVDWDSFALVANSNDGTANNIIEP